MTDNTELKRLARRVIDIEALDGGEPIGEAWGEFEAAATPAAVLDLIAENERLAAACERAEQIIIAECKGASLANVRSNLLEAERDQLKAENAQLKNKEIELKAESEALRATADLQKLLPEVSDALEELELHGLHSDQGYRKLKDWYRKAGLAYRVIQGPMFDAEHGELVSQNTWLRSVVEHYAQQHAPLEPIQAMEGWSARLPGYDLPALLKDAERYRWLRRAGNTKAIALVAEHCLDALDEAIDAAMGKGEQS